MKLKQIISNKTGRLSLQAQKYAPQMLMGFGTVMMIKTVVSACKATTKLEDVLDNHRSKMDDLAQAIECVEEDKKAVAEGREPVCDPEEFADWDPRKDKVIIMMHTVMDIGKIYAPTVAWGCVTLGAFFKAFNIMSVRYLGAVAAYNAVAAAFSDYRGRVAEELGPEVDKHFLYGTEYQEVEITETDEKGKSKTHKEKVEVADVNKLKGYAAVFDKHCGEEWDRSWIYNMKWLRANETAANDILRTRGHIFLNEVYDMIGLPHTSAGAVAGWIYNGDGDGFVNFGLDDPNNESARRMVDGDDCAILLDFNVDGIIFDKI